MRLRPGRHPIRRGQRAEGRAVGSGDEVRVRDYCYHRQPRTRMFAGETRYSACFSNVQRYQHWQSANLALAGTGTRTESHEAYAGSFLPRGSQPGSGPSHGGCGYLGCGWSLTLSIRNTAREDATLLLHVSKDGRAHGSCL